MRPRASSAQRTILVLAVAAAGLLPGCAGEGPDEPGEPDPGGGPDGSGGGATVDFETQIQPLFERRCSCHVSPLAPGGAVLLRGASYENLVGQPSTGRPDLLLVEPRAPDRSYLVIKMDDSVPRVGSLRVGDRMPPDMAPLPAGELALIRRWIEEGAPREAEIEDTAPPAFAGVRRAVAASATALDLFWERATDNETPAEDLVYKAYAATGSGAQVFSSPDVVVVGVTSARVEGLEPETRYHVVVRAEDAAGNRDSNVVEASAVTLAASEPPPRNRPPVADAGGPYVATIGEPVRYSGDGSFDPDGDALAFRWDFGDGRFAVGPSPRVAYALPGVFTTVLVVSDGEFLSAPSTAQVTVLEPAPPPTDPVVDRVCGGCHGLRIELDDGTLIDVTPPGRGERFFPAGFYQLAHVRDRSAWEVAVTRMRERRGCVMTDAEAEHIVDFLGESYSGGSGGSP
jgi:chitodextrinase